MTLNIDRENVDAFYRYKMEAIQAKCEGRGNGTKTVLTNLENIGRDIAHDVNLVFSFIRASLGVQGTNKKGRFIITGHHDQLVLQGLIFDFIDEFVLCRTCRNPETHLSCATKTALLRQDCKACGSNIPLQSRHKFFEKICRFYLSKNEYETKPKEMTTSIRPDEQPSTLTDGQETDWNFKSDLDLVVESVNALTMTTSEKLDMLHKTATDCNYDADIVFAEAARLQCLDRAATILIEAWDNVSPVSTIKRYELIHSRLLTGRFKAQKHMLKSIEQFMFTLRTTLTKKTAQHLFYTLYDMNLVEEEVFVNWKIGSGLKHEQGTNEFIIWLTEVARPFLTWLQEAESDSNSDAELNSPNVIFTSAVKHIEIEEVVVLKPPDDDDDDDIDIDAI